MSNIIEIEKRAVGEKANIILDASKIDLFETCPRRYELRYIRKRELPIVQKARSLDLGGLAHEGLEVYYKMLAEHKHYDERMQATLAKIRARSADPDVSNADPDEINNLLSAVEQSCDYWRPEDENCLEILAVEESFAYTLFEDEYVRVILTGKIDLLVNYNGIGANAASYKGLPFDHKTFSRDSDILRKSNQFINYCVATNSHFLWVNRIGLHDSTAKKPKPAHEKFKRVPLSYDPLYFLDWKQNLTNMILQEYLTCVGNGIYPEKPTSCNKFNRLCEYYEVCDSSGQAAKEFKIENSYVEAKEWDVSKKLEEVK